MTEDEALARLRALASEQTRQGHARFAIPVETALGVAMGDLRRLRREIGRDHPLALALWKTGLYEPRLLAGMVAEPNALTRETAEAWIDSFDGWSITDTLCFDLLAFTPYRWEIVEGRAEDPGEFQRRTSLALVWALTRKDKLAPDTRFLAALDIIEAASTDPRTYVRKAADMALRAIGKRNAPLHAAALERAGSLAASADATAMRIGRSALRDLSSPATLRRLARG